MKIISLSVRATKILIIVVRDIYTSNNLNHTN